jgi:hypothetical protein
MTEAFYLARRGHAADQHPFQKVKAYLEALWNICLPGLCGKNCAESWKESDLSEDISELFANLVARRGMEAVGEGSQSNDADEWRLPIEKNKTSASKVNTRFKNRLPDTLEVREFLEKHPEFAPSKKKKQEHVVRGSSNEDGYRVFKAPKSFYAPNPHLIIPPWSRDRETVMSLLAYLDSYSENQEKKQRFQSVYDAISHRWWQEPLPIDSPLRRMKSGSIDKLMFDIRNKGDEVLYLTPTPFGPRWSLRRAARDRIRRRFEKHFDLPRKIEMASREKKCFVGYLAADMPAPRIMDEKPFIKIVKMVLHKWHLDSAYPDYPYTEAIIAKAIPLVAILKLRRITKITNDSIRAYFLRDALSRAVFPEEVALFLRDHPHMNLTSYDNEVRALADELRSAGWI